MPRRDFGPEEEVALRHRAKAELRKRLGAIRRAVPRAQRNERSQKLADRLTALPFWKGVESVAGYVAMRGEVDPAALLERARRDGKRVALPRVSWDTGTMAMHLAPADSAELEESGHGFLQPREEQANVDRVDLILVPALAIDDRGHRLGFGRGFYDRALRENQDAVSVGIVFHFQLMSELPDTPGDVPVRWVVTDETSFEGSSAGTEAQRGANAGPDPDRR